MVVGCGAARVAPAPVPPSTFDDPPPRTPAADPSATAGETPTGLLSLGGAEAASALVVDLLLAILEEDPAAAEATLAPRVESAAPVRAGAPRTAMEREDLVRHWITLARSAHLGPEVTLAELVERAGISVERAAVHYAEDDRPPGIDEDDLVVRFAVTELGRRAFAGLAPGGVGLLVVRPGPEPVIVAR